MPTWSCNSSVTSHPSSKIAGVTRRSFRLCRHQHFCHFVAHASLNTRGQSQAHFLAAWGLPAMGKAKSAVKPASTNSSCYLQILGNGMDTGDTLPSVLLFFDKHRYLFNAGEGFQRYCVEHRHRLVRMKQVLATQASHTALGGLPGFILTASDANMGADAGTFELDVYGPKGLNHLRAAMASYIRLQGVSVHEIRNPTASSPGTQSGSQGPVTNAEGAHGDARVQQPLIVNEVVEITPVVLEPAAPPGLPAEANGSAVEPPGKRQKRAEGGGEQNPTEQLPGRMEAPQASPAACYICRLQDVPGRFLPDRARELGVRPGPLFGQLKGGEAVMGSSRMVQPEEVTEPGLPGPVVIIADCPTPQHLPSLCSAPTWTRWQRSAQDAGSTRQLARVACIVHLAPPEVAGSSEYQTWQASFGRGVRHIMAHPSQAPGSCPMTSSATLQARLSSIDQDIFQMSPTWRHQSTATKGSHQVDGLKLHLRPQSRLGQAEGTEAAQLDLERIQRELAAEMPELAQAAQLAREQPRDGEATPDVVRQGLTADIRELAQAAQLERKQPGETQLPQAGREEMEVVFLGTGAAIPSKYRNVTGIHLNRFGLGSLLLDCGEGTWGQLVRRYGRSGAEEVLRNLRAVWISHIHADHHAGLPRLLHRRAELLGAGCAPLPVFGPRPLQHVLRCAAPMEYIAHTFIDNVGLQGGPGSQKTLNATPGSQQQSKAHPALAAVKQQLKLAALWTVPVVHCPHAFAVVVEGAAGWKFVFSGDTRPCPQLTLAAKGATMLVHEATFDDGMESEAHAKRHSMTWEAVEAGHQAGAYRTILTHFSQRYPKIPKIDDSFSSSTCIAFDLMSVNLADLPRLPLLVPALTLLCKDADADPQEDPVPVMLT